MVDGECLGFARARIGPEEAGSGRCRIWVAVAHRAHRRGIGTALTAWSADWARSRGYRRMVTSTGVGNEAMQAVARRLGFQVAARWSHFLGSVKRWGVASGGEVQP